jgi:hypothetical protein
MAETSLITIADVQVVRRISATFDQLRFDTFVQEIQRKNLRNVLRDELYQAFMADDKIAGIYADLLNGKEYDDIKYYGMKIILCYWWLAIAAREGDLFQSNLGAIQFVNNPQQSFETAREKERIAVQYMETAEGYVNDMIKFLNFNSSSYPLWQSANEKNESNFLSFKL